jgi:thiamine pyrophosphate-dependent acetolactate synthase large subunit-like protein
MLMAEFAKYRLPVKVVVKHDALGEIKWEQRVFLGNLEHGCELHLIDFAAFARAGGGTGLTIPRPRRVQSRPRPSLLDSRTRLAEAVVDPLNSAHACQGLARADDEVRRVAGSGLPNRWRIAPMVLADRIRETR